MPSKRKRLSSPVSSRKKSKTPGRKPGRPSKRSHNETPKSILNQHPHGEVDSDQLYKVRAILNENETQYLIDWEDSSDGDSYEPTWEPKENANRAAIEEWEAIQASKRRLSSALVPASETPLPSSEPPRKRPGRPRKHPVHTGSPKKQRLPRKQLPLSSPASSLGHLSPGAPSKSHGQGVVTSTEEFSKEVLSSYLGSGLQANLPSAQLDRDFDVEANTSSLPAPFVIRRATSPEIRITPRPHSTCSDLNEDVDNSFFPSSQVITGTQPEPQSVDAAAAPSLSQKNSAYEDTTNSILTNSSSGIHTFATPHQFPSGAIIPDSQSLNDSLSYVTPQHNSGASSKPSKKPQNQQQNQTSIDSQVVPESSALQSIHLGLHALDEDNTTRRTEGPLEQLGVTIEATEAAEALQAPLLATSPIVAQTSSSTSSPPPTESPGKSQSQPQSQSRHPQSSVIEQAAQVPEILELDTTSTTDFVFSRIDNSVAPLVSVPSNNHANNLEQHSAQLQDRLVAQSSVPPFSRSCIETGLGAERGLFDQKLRLRQVDKVNGVDLSLPIPSPIPPAPSQDVVSIGDSAPATLAGLASLRLVQTPEPRSITPAMSSPASSTGRRAGIQQRMDAVRAKRSSLAPVPQKPASAVPARLQSPALQEHEREARSPSMVPAVAIVSDETPEDYHRSERYETLLPGDESENTPTLEPLGTVASTSCLQGIRPIPINFDNHQRDCYKQTVTWHKDLIDEFTSKVWPSDSMLARKAQKLLQDLRDIVLHPDLINSEAHSQSSQVDPEFKAQWDVDSSTKFRFLKHLFAASRVYNLHVVLLVEPGKIVKILQTFLQGVNVNHRMASDGKPHEKPAATIMLANSDDTAGVYYPDLVLSLQANIPDNFITKVQARLSRAGTGTGMLTPTFSLLVPKTIEHVERVMPHYASEAERLHVLIGTVTSLRSEAGKDRSVVNTTEEVATSLVHYVLTPSDWRFGELPSIRMFEPVTISQASTESRTEDTSYLFDSHGVKRDLNTGGETQHGKKRARTDFMFGETADSQDVDVSHISDSVASQQAAAIKALRDEFAVKEKEMDTALHKSQAQLQEHITALETLQYQHEEQRQKLVQAESACDKATESALTTVLRVTSLETKVTDLRNESSDLKMQLREAKESALNNAVPELVEFELLKNKIVALTAEQTRLLAKSKAAEDALDYVREQYQMASNSASYHKKANAALELQVVDLSSRASGEQIKLRQTGLDVHSKNLTARNKQLECMIKTREDLLQRKEDEIAKLKESSRGRINTRQSSVPRTPRIGSPLATGTSSRQGSPAKGPHPLRNAR